MSDGNNSSEVLGPGGEQQEEETNLVAQPQSIPGLQLQPQTNYRGLIFPIVLTAGACFASYFIFIKGDE